MFTLSLPPGRDAAFLSVIFTGEVTLDERREAFGAAIDAALAGETTRILIDLSMADIAPYPVIDGVKYAWHAAQLAFLDKVAYLAPGHEDDLAINLLRHAVDVDVRLFRDREEAHAWLADIGEAGTMATGAKVNRIPRLCLVAAF